jgi:hypothetical protein
MAGGDHDLAQRREESLQKSSLPSVLDIRPCAGGVRRLPTSAPPECEISAGGCCSVYIHGVETARAAVIAIAFNLGVYGPHAALP